MAAMMVGVVLVESAARRWVGGYPAGDVFAAFFFFFLFVSLALLLDL